MTDPSPAQLPRQTFTPEQVHTMMHGMTEPDLTAEIEGIPGDRGWRYPVGQEIYTQLAGQLRRSGFSVDEAIELLTQAYNAAVAQTI